MKPISLKLSIVAFDVVIDVLFLKNSFDLKYISVIASHYQNLLLH